MAALSVLFIQQSNWQIIGPPLRDAGLTRVSADESFVQEMWFDYGVFL